MDPIVRGITWVLVILVIQVAAFSLLSWTLAIPSITTDYIINQYLTKI